MMTRLDLPAEVYPGARGGATGMYRAAACRVGGAGAEPYGGGAPGRACPDRLGVPGGKAERRRRPGTGGAAEYRWPVAQTLRGPRDGRIARPGAAGQGGKIRAGAALADPA